MVFNSYLFILAFLPILLIAYFGANKIGPRWGKLALIAGSALFYGYANLKALMLLAASVAVNYAFARLIQHGRRKKALLFLPVAVNAGLLLALKYANFAISNVNALLGAQIPLRNWILPVGISFFTFQQIAYLVSVQREEIRDCALMDYLAYILYFPKLLMGPLAEPTDFIEQLNDPERKKLNWEHLAEGIKMFSFGLFKKMVLADTFAAAVSWGFARAETATSMELILTMLSYTFEIYFDFSGYSDMAIGVSRMLNIELAMNFDSPYKALSIRDFWKRWHISLTKFLTKYIYIPLGGNRKGLARQIFNILVVWMLTGLWHGASWNFVLWGLYFGVILALEKIFLLKFLNKIPAFFSHFYSLLLIIFGWVIFECGSLGEIASYLKAMFSVGVPGWSGETTYVLANSALLLAVLAVCSTELCGKLGKRMKSGYWRCAGTAALLLLCVLFLAGDSYNPFLYFRF